MKRIDLNFGLWVKDYLVEINVPQEIEKYLYERLEFWRTKFEGIEDFDDMAKRCVIEEIQSTCWKLLNSE